MAKEYLPESQMSLGGYNPENRMLTLEFDNMPPMYLTVPEDEVKTFMNPADLELRNPVYGIGAADKFELVYAEVYNKSTGCSFNRSVYVVCILYGCSIPDGYVYIVPDS